MQDIKKLNTKRLIKKFEKHINGKTINDTLAVFYVGNILIKRGYYSFVMAHAKTTWR